MNPVLLAVVGACITGAFGVAGAMVGASWTARANRADEERKRQHDEATEQRTKMDNRVGKVELAVGEIRDDLRDMRADLHLTPTQRASRPSNAGWQGGR